MIPYQGCSIYSFAAPLPQPILSRPPEAIILGHRVWLSKGSLNEEPNRDTYFVSMLKPDLMLVCDSREFFRETVLRAAMSTQQRAALPADLPEWKLVDRSTPLWGITHYPTNSPIPHISGHENVGAIGLIVEFGLDNDSALARMIAKTDPWKEVFNSADFYGAAKSRHVASNVWELTTTGKSDAAGFTALVLMGELGFEIVI